MKKILLFSILLAASTVLRAQCLLTQTGGTNVIASNGYLWGQTFTTTCAGTLDYVQFTANANGTVQAGTLNIYNGSSVTGSVYSQPFPAFNVTQGNPMRITLTGVFNVAAATQYTFEFFVNVNNLATFADVYSGGSAWQNSAIVTTADFDFAVNILAPTEVLSLDHSDEIQIYPNPASDIARISFGSTPFNGTLELFSIEGQLVTRKEVSGPSTELDLSALDKDIYFVKISSAGKTSTFKVIHQ